MNSSKFSINIEETKTSTHLVFEQITQESSQFVSDYSIHNTHVQSDRYHPKINEFCFLVESVTLNEKNKKIQYSVSQFNSWILNDFRLNNKNLTMLLNMYTLTIGSTLSIKVTCIVHTLSLKTTDFYCRRLIFW